MAFISHASGPSLLTASRGFTPIPHSKQCCVKPATPYRRCYPRAELPSEPPSTDLSETDKDATILKTSSRFNGQPGSENGESNAAVKLEEKARDIRRDGALTVAWIAAAAGVAYGIGRWKGAEAALQFVTAYIVEYSLSVDNLFVFLLIFSYFQVPRSAQTRVLSFGIIGAIIFRGIMIVTGEALVQRFHAVSLGFAGILLFSAFKLITSGGEKDEDVSESAVVKFASKLLPFTDRYDGERFFTTGEDGSSLATPLMLVLLSIEFSDLIFALDSVPAVLGISDDSLVIYVSNIMAIAGLRNLYFVLSDAIGNLRFLPQALAVVLAFVGGKMAAGVAGYDVGILPSLSIIVGALTLGVGLSFAFPELQKDENVKSKTS